MLTRYLTKQVKNDLNQKMVFLGGARQVGKTTLAKSILTKDSVYMNWDIPEHREQILRGEVPNGSMLVLDEIHKYREWRQYLKGIFDLFGNTKKILVTGSARLDYYRFGGDSLQGRYHYLRMLPLSTSELGIKSNKDLHTLLTLSGFPEPFFTGSETEALRWSREYRSRLIQDDIVSLENTTSLQKIELLMLRLPSLVGSPLSINSLREDLNVSHKAVSSWIEILERLYAIFRVPPFESNLLRAVKKEQKHYHYDWTLVKEVGLRFENMVAVHLLKWVYWQQDVLGLDIELRYFRDIDGREVDFVIVKDGNPTLCIECKIKDESISKAMLYFLNKFPVCSSWQITLDGSKNVTTKEGIRIAPAEVFLGDLV
jgi:predicted AAA+ superfamily ATPase